MNTSYNAATSSFTVGIGGLGLDYALEAEAFGQGTEIDYDAASGGYTFTRTDGTTVSVGDSDIIDSNADSVQWRIQVGGFQHDVRLANVDLEQNGGPTYHVIGVWTISNQTNPLDARATQFMLFGNKTETLPSGSASYDLDGGIGLTGHDRGSTGYNFQPNSTGSLDVNFGSGAITTNLDLIGTDETDPSGNTTKDFGDFAGTGNITSGADFEGTFGADGEFYGAFFGPNAEEVGYTMFLENNDMEAVGTVSGVQD